MCMSGHHDIAIGYNGKGTGPRFLQGRQLHCVSLPSFSLDTLESICILTLATNSILDFQIIPKVLWVPCS